jgi:hypothetical protein
VPPESPPEDLCEVLATLPLDLIRIEPEWASVGSSQEVHEALNVVTRSAHPWSYSAWAHPDLPDLTRDRHWYWLRIRVARAAGSPSLSLYDRARNTLRSETSVPASEVARDYYLELNFDEIDERLPPVFERAAGNWQLEIAIPLGAVRTTRLGDEADYSGGGVQRWRNGG